MLRGSLAKSEAVVFASRPGLRLWIAATDGSVSATYLFKDLLLEQHQNIELLPDTLHGVAPLTSEELQFGPLLLFKVSLIVIGHNVTFLIQEIQIFLFLGHPYRHVQRVFPVRA